MQAYPPGGGQVAVGGYRWTPAVGRPHSMQGTVCPWSSSGSSGHKGGIDAPDVGGGDGCGAQGHDLAEGCYSYSGMVRLWFDLMILKVFSNLSNSMIL